MQDKKKKKRKKHLKGNGPNINYCYPFNYKQNEENDAR